MTRQTLKSKLRAGYTISVFAFAILSPAFFLCATLFLGDANATGALLCTMAMLLSAILADYCSKQVNKYK